MVVTVKRVNVNDLKLKALVYGLPGSGKTVMAAQTNDHPTLAPALFLNFEGGLLSVAGRGDIDQVEIDTLDHLEEAFWELADANSELSRTYNTVVIDSGSELYNKALREAVEKSVGKTARSRGRTVDDIELADYGIAAHRTLRLFTWFRDLPKHLIVTAHPKFTYPPSASVAAQASADPIDVKPAFSNKLAVSLMGMFDSVWYLYQYGEDGKDDDDNPYTIQRRGMLTIDAGPYKAKTRGIHFPEALGQTVIDPHLPTIYDLLLSSESGSSVAPDHRPAPMPNIDQDAMLVAPEDDSSTLDGSEQSSEDALTRQYDDDSEWLSTDHPSGEFIGEAVTIGQGG